MKIGNPTTRLIDKQLDALAGKIALRRSADPQWVSQNLAVQPAVNRIIANAMSQNDPILHLSGLAPGELFKSIGFVAKQYTQAVITTANKIASNKNPNNTLSEANRKVANKTETNKKIYAAKKLTAIMLILNYAEQSMAMADKKLKKLHQYLAKKAAKETNDEYAVPSYYTNLTPAPILKPAPQNDLETFNPDTASSIEIAILLSSLNLKPNATHENIKEAFESKRIAFIRKAQPTPQEKREFSECSKCYEKLMLISIERLQNLSQTLQKELDDNPITTEELSQFAKTLNLSLDHPVTPRNLQEKYLECGLNNPNAQDQLQKTQDTLGKLEARFLLEPGHKTEFVLRQFSPDNTASLTSQLTPQLTPIGK